MVESKREILSQDFVEPVGTISRRILAYFLKFPELYMRYFCNSWILWRIGYFNPYSPVPPLQCFRNDPSPTHCAQGQSFLLKLDKPNKPNKPVRPNKPKRLRKLKKITKTSNEGTLTKINNFNKINNLLKSR